MERTYTNEMGVVQQKATIPWNKIKPGDVLMNYGNSTSLYILFVDDIRAEEMDYQMLSVINMGDVRIKKYTGTRKEWDEMAEKYYNDIWNDKAFLYDHLRPGDDVIFLGDIFVQCFRVGINLL